MNFDAETIEHYRLRLRYKVWYHLGSFCPDAEDVVQETMARFLHALRENKMHKPESVGAFLSGICNNVIFEYRRRLWREAPSDNDSSKPAQEVAPEAELLELRDAIEAGLAQLSDRDREILRAFFLEERSKEEICRETGLSDGQFRVALFRAKERFRKIYRQQVKRQAGGNH